MNRYLTLCLVALFSVCTKAQIVENTSESGSASTTIVTEAAASGSAANMTAAAGSRSAAASASVASASYARYGYCNRRAIVEAQPDYAVAMTQLEALKKQYEVEVEHNEADFRRQYQEYLYGQKDFPQPILLKRQRDLQTAMERGIAFRTEADSLLCQARIDLVRPIEERVDAAVSAVAAEHGYDYVVDTDKGAFLYLNPRLSEDITHFVEEKLR